MENKEKIVLSLRDAFLWVVLTSVVGLVQVILYAMVASFVSSVSFDFFDWVKNGAIIAFSLALVSSIFFDTHFQKEHRKYSQNKNSPVVDKYFGGLVYKLLPWLIVLMVTFSTMLDYVCD